MIKEKALSLPLSLDAYGKFSVSTNQSKIWADRVRMVIGTNLRERVMRPDFGTLVPSSFMETQQTATLNIQSEVEGAFAKQLQTLRLQSTNISFDEYTGTANVTITYDLPNGETIETVVAFVYLQGNRPPYEENL